jgi:flagellar hook-basal body complex protein FliE
VTVLPISAIGGEWSVAHIASLGAGDAAAGTGAAGGVEATGGFGAKGGFGETLSSAVSSLEQTQRSADGAAQALATGTVTDPESAVVTVEDAQLAMQLAGQIRSKVTEAAQEIFQTQV